MFRRRQEERALLLSGELFEMGAQRLAAFLGGGQPVIGGLVTKLRIGHAVVGLLEYWGPYEYGKDQCSTIQNDVRWYGLSAERVADQEENDGNLDERRRCDNRERQQAKTGGRRNKRKDARLNVNH